MKISKKDSNYIDKMIRVCFLSSALVLMGNSVYAADFTTTTLPSGGTAIIGGITIPTEITNNTMNITQTEANGVITWTDFSIGKEATVNFQGPVGGYNTLNYVNSSNVSQIYGTMTADNGGKIYVVNPAGVVIGADAKIEVGSLYVSNKALNENSLSTFAGSIDSLVDSSATTTSAELMSLGSIQATSVTFDGDRVVLNVSGVTSNGKDQLAAANITVTGTDVVLGYDAYDSTSGYTNVDTTTNLATVNGTVVTKAYGYMWVSDIEQLQAINANATTLAQNYALKKNIDAKKTSGWNDGQGFDPLGYGGGTDFDGMAYSGKFDGLGFSVKDLTISRSTEDYVGLFGYVSGSVKNLTVDGNVSGNQYVAGIIGYTSSNAIVDNVVNQAAVSGNENVGGVIGYNNANLSNVELYNEGIVTGPRSTGGVIGLNNGVLDSVELLNTGTVQTVDASSGVTEDEEEETITVTNTGGVIGYNDAEIKNSSLTNEGSVSGDNTVGGVIGYNIGDITASELTNSNSGSTTNSGSVSGNVDVGGVIGRNTNATNGISNKSTLSNTGNVSGKENTGGIIGYNSVAISESTLQNKSGTVKGEEDNTGGVIGQNIGSLQSVTLTNKATVNGSTDHATSEGIYKTGGIIGLNGGKGSISGASELINEGTVSGYSSVGGIMGQNDATLSGIIMTNSGRISGTNDRTGGIIGYNQGQIASRQDADGKTVYSRLTNSGEISGDQYVGGIIAYNNSAGTINNSTLVNKGTVDGKNRVAGVIGYNLASFKDNGTVKMTNLASITATQNNVGGIIGENVGEIEMEGLTMTNGDDSTEIIVSGTRYVGGVIGQTSRSISGATLINSAKTTVSGGRNSYYTGGVIGGTTDSNDSYVLSNVKLYNYGTVSAGSNGLHTGGVIGGNQMDIVSSTLANYGSISGGLNYTGGVIGSNTAKGSITNSSLINTVAVESGNYVGGLIGRNEGEISNTTGEDAKLVNDQEVSGTSNVGGIIGYNTGKISGYTLVNKETVTGTSDNVGGIFGYNSSDIDYLMINTADITGATGSSGSATGGLIGYNTGDLSTDEDLELKNEKTITGKGDVGGLIGYNSGSITGYTLVNSGTVIGTTEDAGGLIGDNSADITGTSIYNTLTGIVSGTSNVGGLIGNNSGTVEGGRDSGGNYYKYQVYNNGLVVGGTVSVEASGNVSYEVSTDSSNIGGLIGLNTVTTTTDAGTGEVVVHKGTLTAGYNTGSVSGGSNVGGIVGSNAAVTVGTDTYRASVDQVFNTLAGSATISGTTDVGGLIGSNSGELKNAYNTSTVSATGTDAVVGNVVGYNSGSISNVYATNTSGSLIGSNAGSASVSNAYSFVKDDDSATDVLATEEEQKATESYDGLKDDTTVWKFYDGYTTPLLKVFLTKATYNTAEGAQTDFTYNTKAQGFVVKAVDNTVTVYKNDGETVVGTITVNDSKAAHNLADYLTTYVENSTDNLLVGGENTNAGTYAMLYSHQINTSNADNPNNLGYDIETSYKIDKAAVTLTLADIYRIYGSAAKYYYDDTNKIDVTNYSERYSFSENVNTAMQDELIAGLTVHDYSLSTETGRTTQNYSKDAYTWTVEDTANLAANYSLTIEPGEAFVEKAALTITLADVQRTYGSLALDENYSYTIASYSALVNGDEGDPSLISTEATGADAAVKDGALTGASSGRVTNSGKGDYTWTTDTKNVQAGFDLNNYNITITPGKSVVNPLAITAKVDDATITAGQTPTITGTDLLSLLVNGDKEENPYGLEYEFAVSNPDIITVAGTYDDSLILLYTFSDPALENERAFNNNYTLTIDYGTLTVLASNDQYEFGEKYSWNKNREERERKAEVHYEDGGMRL